MNTIQISGCVVALLFVITQIFVVLIKTIKFVRVLPEQEKFKHDNKIFDLYFQISMLFGYITLLTTVLCLVVYKLQIKIPTITL